MRLGPYEGELEGPEPRTRKQDGVLEWLDPKVHGHKQGAWKDRMDQPGDRLHTSCGKYSPRGERTQEYAVASLLTKAQGLLFERMTFLRKCYTLFRPLISLVCKSINGKLEKG